MLSSASLKRLLIVLNLSALPMILFLGFLSGDAGDKSAPSGHSQVACYRCHSIVADIGAAPSPDAYDVQCRICHSRMANNHLVAGLPFHDNPNRTCNSCHSFHTTEEVTAGSRTFALSFSDKNRLQQCLACHGRGENPAALSEGHRRAAALYHSDLTKVARLSASDACMVCHSENAKSSSLPVSLSSIPRFNDHSNHPTGIVVHPGSGQPGNQIRATIDPRIRLVEGKLECQSCHSLSSQSRYYLGSFEDSNELCRGCHLVGS